MIKDILKLKKDGKTDKEIGDELKITRQKVYALVKKHEYEESNKVVKDEFPAEMFAKKTNVVKDESMGGCIIMTAREYHDYSEANGRYQGLKEGQKTILDPMELRVSITGIQRGDRSAVDTKNHLMAKHGLTEDDIRKVAMKLTKEEEISYREVCKSLNMKP